MSASYLLLETTSRIAVLVTVLAVAVAVKALASVLQTWIVQAFRTRRLTRSLEGAKPHQRPGIIQAFSQLEGRSTGRSDRDEIDCPDTAAGDHQPPVLILSNKRSHESHED
jgi:hypothetical protein